MNDFEIKKISIEVAFKKMRDSGMEITEEDAVLVMEFLYILTYFVVKKHFKV